MSHTGRRISNRRAIENTYPVPEPKKIPVKKEVSLRAILDGEVLEGEFKGDGEHSVLVGLSSITNNIDVFDIFNNGAEKGVVIGYITTSTNFEIYTNNGTGGPTTVTQFDNQKDDITHSFNIILKNGYVDVQLGDQIIKLTSNIPTINDNLELISYGLY